VITVVKVGGDAPGAVAKVAALAARGREVVVVHGGGPRISQLCRRRGLDPCFVDGQRVTDAAVLAVVGEALSEQRTILIEQLERAGLDARSLPDALDGAPCGDARLGLVGRITAVDGIGLRAMLAAGIVPVISPMAGGLNVNADHAASAVAAAVGASELIFLSDVPGVMDAGGRVIRRISAGQAPALIHEGHVTGGMIPKLNAGTEALAQGVWRVWIGAETMVTA
jgi:acetylglutamate kinase